MSKENNKTKKEDRRVRKTKALLCQELIRLMEERDIKDISVKELSDLADINRGTFYLHYTDIHDMLKKLEEELFVEFNQILDRNMGSLLEHTSLKATLLDIFSFLEHNKALVKVLMGPHGDLAFVNYMKDLVKARIYNILNLKQSAPDPVYIEAFIVSGCIGVIEAWLADPVSRTPQEMAEVCCKLLTSQIL